MLMNRDSDSFLFFLIPCYVESTLGDGWALNWCQRITRNIYDLILECQDMFKGNNELSCWVS